MIGPRDIPLLPVFVAVADGGSFTAGARALGLAKSVVSQHVRALEERCGVRLIERTTRRLHVTQEGLQVLDAAREVLNSVHALDRMLATRREEPAGTLRVTAPNDQGIADAVAGAAAELMRNYPAVRVELLFDDAVRELVGEGLDVALRLGALATSSYVVRKLATEPEIILASPMLVDLRGEAKAPKALAGAPWIAHVASSAKGMWSFTSSDHSKQQLAVDVRAVSNHTYAVRSLLLKGVGYGVLPLHMVHDDVRAGRLVRVCPDWCRRQLTFHALLPTRNTPPRVRAFLAALVDALRPLGFAASERRGK
jgi:DNA-binding transcriptional LysR family regulator